MFEPSAAPNYAHSVGDVGFSSLVTLSLVLLCFVSWFAYRASPEDRHATFLWFLGSLSLAVASACYALRPLFPQQLDINVFCVNFFLCSGVGLHVSGLVRLDGPDRMWWVFWVPGVVASFVGAWVLRFDFGRYVQPVLIASVLLVWIGRVFFWVLGRRWEGRIPPAMKRVLGFYAFAAVTAVLFGARVYWIPLLPGAVTTQFTVGMTAAVLFLLDLSLLAIGFAELLLIHDLSSQRYRHEAESKLKVMVDLEEYRRLQRALVEKERDLALGRMVASVNHALNSPLAALVSANASLSRSAGGPVPGGLGSLRRLTDDDWSLVERALAALRPGPSAGRRRRVAALTPWLLTHGFVDSADVLVDFGLDLRMDLLEELVRSPRRTEILRLIVHWADGLSARTIIGLATMKASKLLLSLREWFEGGTGETGSFSVSPLLRSAVQTLRSSYPALTIDTSLEASAEVVLPQRQLERVFHAVLDNGARATGGSGCVVVRSIDTEDGVRVEIADDGPGVGAKKEPLLFEPFVGASAESQSLGVSLYFCRLFLSEWGGSITYTRDGGLTTFIIQLVSS